jgi:hypothetical protein
MFGPKMINSNFNSDNMKTISILLLLIASISTSYGQMDSRATIKRVGLTAEAWELAPTDIAFPNVNNAVAINLVFSLPANGSNNPADAPVPTAIAIAPPLTTLTLTTLAVEIWNDRFDYTYLLTGTIPTTATWVGGSEHKLLSVTYPASQSGKFPKLDNLLNSGQNGGGNNEQAYWYFLVGANQRSDTEGVPFYASTGTLGTYPNTDQWVQSLNPLPVKLIGFSAEKSGEKSAMLNWSTASESNSSYFAIERSYDKVSWKTAGQVKAAGNSQIVLNYQFLDKDVYNGVTSNLTVYYRLKMVDFDNSFEYSPIESVNFGNARNVEGNTSDFLVYPNPASEGIHVEWNADQVKQPTAFEFYDLAGKLIHTEKIEEQTSEHYVDFTKTNIQTGLIMMRVLSGDETINYKQIVVGQNH